MSQLILSVHSGAHDAGAALFEDYRVLAAVQLERLTRHKCDGREHPDLATLKMRLMSLVLYRRNSRGM